MCKQVDLEMNMHELRSSAYAMRDNVADYKKMTDAEAEDYLLQILDISQAVRDVAESIIATLTQKQVH